MKLLKKAFGWLFSRWVISVIGIMVLCLLIWFVGPLVAVAGITPLAGVEARFITILVVVLIWGINNLVAVARARRTNRDVLDGLVVEPAASDPLAGDPYSHEEIETLRERFREALAVLKKAKLGGRGGRRYLYQLPWYVVIGPPGVGKTTALKNSDLKFPLAQSLGQDAVQGVGGTRNCDWWFTDEAVLLDTAGRYTTQDSDESADSAAWSGFLELLKKHRRRRALDGVVVAFSLADLAQQSVEQRQLHSRAIRSRLQELYRSLKLKMPVYVVFTKCDLMSGFIEFFDDLSREGRHQVWGTTFSMAETEHPETLLNAFGGHFDTLMARLDDRLIPRLEQEREVQRRRLIHGFPQQMKSMKEAVHDFLGEVFAPSRFEEQTLLRGVYFSSGTQEGTPIDRLISSVSASFGLERQAMPAFSGHGRSYFLNRLLREVVFREAEVVKPTGLFDLNRPWIQRAAYGAAAMLVLVLAGAWYASYALNRDYVSVVAGHVASYEEQTAPLVEAPASIIEILPTLNTLREIPGGYEKGGEVPPTLFSLGLYQGGKLGSAAKNAYARALNTVLLPRVVGRLEDQIRGNMNRGEFLYEALKVYLMLGIAGRFDREVVSLWVTLDWTEWFSGADNTLREQLGEHLVSLLEGDLNSVPLDADLIARARQKLAQLTLAQRVYAQVKGGRSARQLDEWRITDKIGDADAQSFRRRSGKRMTVGIPGFFTRKGFNEVFLRETPALAQTTGTEAWIIGPEFSREIGESDMTSLTRDVSRLYARDYIAQWDDLLNDLEIVQFQSLAHSVSVMKVLTGPSSPLKTLLRAVARETQLVSLPSAVQGSVEQSDQLQKLRDRLTEFFKGKDQAAPLGDNPILEIDRRFEWLRDLANGRGEGGPLIDPILATLNEIYVVLKRRESTGSGNTSDLIQQLRNDSERQKPLVAGWMDGVAQGISRITVRDIRSQLNAIWTTTVVPFCRSALGNRYPLVKNNPEDVNLDDFARFFGPQGKMDVFFENFLKPYVDSTVSPWRLSKSGGAAVGLSSNVLSQFEAAARIKNAFFGGGTAQPSIRFQLKPLALDKTVSQVLIELGDQRHTYRHGPQRPMEMRWPPPSGSLHARVVFKPIGAANTASITAEGPWAWFRILDQARIETTTRADRFRVIFEAQGLQAVYELFARSVTNPFQLPELERFRCLERL